MKSQAIKFFPREVKLSTAEEFFLSDFNIQNKERMCNQRLESFAVYILLLMRMSEDDSSGYFIEYTQESRNLLAQKIGTDNKFLHRVVLRALERGLFDKGRFQKYGILTSPDIQDKYFFAKARCTKLRIVEDYLYGFVYEKYENVLKKSIIVNKNGEIVNKNSQTETKTETKTNTETETNTPTEAKPQSADVLSLINKFKQAFPNKSIEEGFQIPDYVDIEQLICKIKESPEFLAICDNLDLKWCCQKNNYDKIISGAYSKRQASTPSNKRNYSNREYSKEELSSLYSNIEEIEI